MTVADASKTYMYVFDHYIAQLVDGIDAGTHKHGAYQLSISLDGRPHLAGPDPDSRQLAMGHLTAPNTPHSLSSVSGQQALIWLAPESTLARELGSAYLTDTGFGVLPDDLVDRLPVSELRHAIADHREGHEVKALCDALMNDLGDAPLSPSDDLHPAIREAVGIIHDRDQYVISADDLADQVGLSTSRLLHLFTEQMRTPLRPHLQWLRLIQAMFLISDGSTVTDAAATAGFSDAAHLTRSMKQYIGIRPSEIADHPDIKLEMCLTQQPA